MRKFITAGAAALLAAGTLAASAAPASAQMHGGFHGGSGFHGGFHGRGGFRGGGGFHRGFRGGGFGVFLGGPWYGGYYGCAERVWDPYYGAWTIRYYC